MIEDLLTDISTAGWTVYQLCQGQSPALPWRAYLRHPTPPRIAYAEGPTAYLALALALDSIEAAIAESPRAASIEARPEPVDLRSLLSLKPVVQINRRI